MAARKSSASKGTKKTTRKASTAKKTAAKTSSAGKASGSAKKTSSKAKAAGGAAKAEPKGSAGAKPSSRKRSPKARWADVLERCDKMLGVMHLPESESVLEKAVLLVLREQGTENTTSKAMKALKDEFVDWNEVRVSRPSELARLMSGSSKSPSIRRYHDRAARVREMIDQVYNDKNEPSLEFLVELRSKARFEYLEDLDDLGLHNAYALVQWMSGDKKLSLVSTEMGEAAHKLGLCESAAVTKARAELSALADGELQLVAMQAHLNQLGGMETEEWPPSIRELLA